MIRCLAVDDEAYATRMLADFIAKVPYLELAGVSNNAIDALERVRAGGIDLVFLDIRMPQLSGLDFLKLCGNKCKVILTTAYSEYALEGYEFNVIDYLLKPIAFERFFKAAEKALEIIEPVSGHVRVMQESNVNYLFVKGESKNKFIKVNYDEILYVEGLKNYVSIFTASQRIVTYQSLRDLEDVLPKASFCRIHKSYIVSLDKVRMVDGYLLYIGEKGIPIGNSYREEFLKLIGKG
ncbi:LytTR family DNA-binding domain-containing protein [Terrimonas sp. NA20]|uniref:LytTR family DNA-binding domain-containing protein n=1 Tax=Terrimonas ginsenosidimutans TaxID=2908004 RepID=A0ABS9KV23_9BACT|nr:LytTR family DNA-binding domain-containing protein [Terrimonas ginsenosidimutans]MCG2616197.1 LytTR family DNA-binding domain-containing protein [Terrimonas ginsenosidimutans]